MSKIKTMLSTTKMLSLNFQSSQPYMSSESLQDLYCLYFISLQGGHNQGQTLSY